VKRLTLGLAMGVFLTAGAIAWAGYTWEYTDGKKAEFGLDVRVRYDLYDRDVNPTWSPAGREVGPDFQYFRIRERVWGKLDLWEGAKLVLRLGNRWQYYTSHFLDPNNQHDSSAVAGGGSPTWEAPDEVYIDNLYVEWTSIMDSPWSVTLGRQDFMLGNGMVLLEGTPFDQGRSIYFTGASTTYQTECDTVKMFGFYDDYRDRTALIHDQKRSLRYGNTTVAGIDWTHRFTKMFNTELYYMWSDIEDDDNDGVAFANDGSLDSRIQFFGGRVFGSPTDLIDYGVEFCKQSARYPLDTDSDPDPTGSMLDARLKFKTPDDTAMKPTFGLQVTQFSGDDPKSGGENEGWVGLFDTYPIYREEFLPARFGALGWTNLTQYRADTCLQVMEKVKATVAYAYLVAEYGENSPTSAYNGGGNTMGELISLFVDWKAMESLVLSFEGATFIPGDYYAGGQQAEWLRLQAVWTY